MNLQRSCCRTLSVCGLALLGMVSLHSPAAWGQTPPTAPPAPPETPTPAPEQAPSGPAPANYKVQFSGLVDGYYQFQFNNPRFRGVPNNLGFPRVYDVRHNAPTISLAELNVFENARPGGLGFKATFIAGDTADINHANFPPGGPHDGRGESRFKNVQQLYGTYAFTGAGGGIDLGKFYTPFGYEVTEANGNYNYSRSIAYNLLPFYHTGVRAYTPSYHGLVLTGYLVRALFNTPTAGVQDDNGELAWIGQANYTDPKGKYSAIENIGGGTDKLGGTETKSTLSDTDFTYNFNPNMLAGLNYVYSRQRPEGAAKFRADGYAAYFRQQLTPKTAYALRWSGANLRTAGVPTAKPWEITGTYELKPKANIITRLEYRHDNSNVATFLDRDTQPTKKNQDTVTLAGIFTF